MSDVESINSDFIDDTVMEGIEDLVNELKIKDNTNHAVETASVKTIRDSLPPAPSSPPPQPQSKPEDNWSKSSGKTGDTKTLDFLSGNKQFPNYIDDEIKTKLSTRSYNSERRSRKERPSSDTKSINSNTTIRRLKLLEEWETLCNDNKNYNARQFDMNNHAKEIEDELQKVKIRHRRKKWINIMCTVTWLIAKVIEIGVNKISPEDTKPLLGWANNLRNNFKDFEDDFGDLYNKYSSSGKESPPEVRIIFGLFVSGIQFAFVHHAPKMLASMITKNSHQYQPHPYQHQQPQKQSVFATQTPVTNMTGPDIFDDPEMAELLADQQDEH